MMMDPRCNDNRVRLEDHQTNLEGLEVHQTSQGVHKDNRVAVHQTNLEVHRDNKVREEDLQRNLEDLEVHQTNLEARQANLEDHQIKDGPHPKRWILIQVIPMTKHLQQREKLPRKEKVRLQKEKVHLRRESRDLQTEQVATMTMMVGVEVQLRWPMPCKMGESIRLQWQQHKPLLRLARCWGRGSEAPSEKASEASSELLSTNQKPRFLAFWPIGSFDLGHGLAEASFQLLNISSHLSLITVEVKSEFRLLQIIY